MSEKEPSPSEQAAADAISAVEDLAADPCYEPNGRDTAPDWRMKLTGERVADVEVTRAADEGTRSLLAAGHDKPWPARELSHKWMVQVSDLAPERNRSLKEVIKALEPVLRRVEAEGGTTGEMTRRAQEHLSAAARQRGRPVLEGTAWVRGRAVTVCGCKPAGPGGGCITTFVSPAVGGNLSTTAELAAAIQDCIAKKQEQGQLEEAPGLRWLVVIMDEFTLAPMQLRAFAEDVLDEGYTVSVDDGAPESAEHLDEITFPHLDEVWVVGPSRGGKWVFVLRLRGTGSNWQLRALESAAVLGEDWYSVPGLTFWRH